MAETTMSINPIGAIYKTVPTMCLTSDGSLELVVGSNLRVLFFTQRRRDIIFPPSLLRLIDSQGFGLSQNVSFGKRGSHHVLTVFLISRPTARLRALHAFWQSRVIAALKSSSFFNRDALPLSPVTLHASSTFPVTFSR
jgi:hypothetical protein